jgi:4-amino-4-deoxy-L-arabinose transferase-like glycosyltransferase
MKSQHKSEGGGMILSFFMRVVAVLFICFSLLFISFNPIKESRHFVGNDEWYYFRYALAVEKKGTLAFSQMLRWYNSSDEARKHPSPMRAGYLLWISFLFKIFGPSFAVLELCSTMSFIILLYVCYYYVRKYFTADVALLLVWLLSSSPLMLGLSRRALLDGPLNLLWGTLVWVFFDFLMSPGKKKYVFIVLLLALSITVKEMTVVLIPFFMLAGAWFKRKGTAIRWSEILGIMFWPLLIVTVFYSWILSGGPAPYEIVSGIFKTHFAGGHPNPYAIDYSSGPWFRYILDFLLLTPVTLLLMIGYLGFLVARRDQLTLKIKYLLAYFIFVYTALNALPHSKVVRFVVNLDMVLNLFAVLMLIELFKPQDSLRRQEIFFGAVIGIIVLNWCIFSQLFYQSNLLDPISYHLLRYRHLIPVD